MTIIRVQKSEQYTVLPNHVLNDERLSWEARGLLAYLLSKPDDWRVSTRALVQAGTAGKDKVQRVLRELEAAGYLVRRRVRGPGGKFVWESVVYEFPQQPSGDTMTGFSGHGTMTGFSGHGKTSHGLSSHGKTSHGKPGHIQNTEQQSTEELSTEKPSTEQQTSNQVKQQAAVINARASDARRNKIAAADARKKNQKKSKLPDDLRAGLREIGWRGSLSEIERFWNDDPTRVRALLAHARRKGWGGGLLRQALRSGEWPPDEALDEIDPAAKYKTDPFARFYE